MISGRLSDKVAFVVIYTLVSVLIVIKGAQTVANYAVDVVFYHEYLQPWETRLIAIRHQIALWPPMDTGDPGAYMRGLVKIMSANGLAPPKSNTKEAYVYRIRKIGERTQQVLVKATLEQMVIYNLPVSTFDRLDRFIDGRSDPAAGRLTGRWSTDGVTRIADWRM